MDGKIIYIYWFAKTIGMKWDFGTILFFECIPFIIFIVTISLYLYYYENKCLGGDLK